MLSLLTGLRGRPQEPNPFQTRPLRDHGRFRYYEGGSVYWTISPLWRQADERHYLRKVGHSRLGTRSLGIPCN
jgi:hypothetical protein